MFCISSLSLGCKNIVLSLSFARQSEKKFCEHFVLFFVVSPIDARYLLKVLAISKGLVIISLLSRGHVLLGTREGTDFRKIRDFIHFHVFLTLFIFFQNIYIISFFTFLHKDVE